MSILFRYILRSFAGPALMCFCGLSALFLLFTSFDLINACFKADTAVTGLVAFDFLSGMLSQYLEWLLPAVFLLATLYTMWQFCRHSELIAMRANGISMLTIVCPILCVAILAAGLSFVNTEFYKPDAAARANAIQQNDFRITGREKLKGVGFASARGESIDHTWAIGEFDPVHPDRLSDVRITFFRPDGSMDYRCEAPRAMYMEPGGWLLLDGVKTTFYDELNNVIAPPEGASEYVALRSIPRADETPDQMRAQNTDSDLSSAKERIANRKLRNRTGLSKLEKHEDSYATYNHFAAPISIILVTLFAIPAGIASGRQSVFKGILLALSLFLAYYVITALAMLLSNHGILKPAMAVSLPSILFGAAATMLFWRQR